MTVLKVAHVKEQGVDLVIVPLNDDFRFKPFSEQQLVTVAIQRGVNQSGLKGTAVPVWNDNGRMSFIAPRNWHPYFQSLNLLGVWANVNREIYV